MSRIEKRFEDLKGRNRAAFVSFTMAGDPDYDTSLEIVRGLARRGGRHHRDSGMPFTDPMADGPTIQLAGQRALEAGRPCRRPSIWSQRSARGTNTPDRLDGLLQPDLLRAA